MTAPTATEEREWAAGISKEAEAGKVAARDRTPAALVSRSAAFHFACDSVREISPSASGLDAQGCGQSSHVGLGGQNCSSHPE